MSEVIRCDIAIIGGGAGGLTLAAGASQMGANVVLVESGKMGGDCLNYGCVPSKSLLSAAKAFYHAQEASHFGLHAKEMQMDFSKVMRHVKKVISTIAEHDSVKRFESLGVKVIRGKGTFLDKRTLKAGSAVIKAKRFVIATGSSPFIPPIPGLDKVNFETNETLFSLKALPEHLVVIGGGPIGCELAQAISMLGAKVTVLEGGSILPKDDPDCVEIIRSKMKAMKIAIYEGCKVQKVVKDAKSGVAVQVEIEGKRKRFSGSHLLIATGRRANVQALNLEKAGVTFSPVGVQVNKRLRSSNRRVYAIGDAAGSFQFTHIANYHAGIVLRNLLFKLPAKVDYHAVPWVTYTEPEMSHVGMTTADVNGRSDTLLIELPLTENDRALAEHETTGKIQAIVDRKGRILGVTIVASHAGELILPWIIAVRERKTLRMFTDTIVPYPTTSEISKRVAGEFYTPKLFSEKMRRLVRLIQRLS